MVLFCLLLMGFSAHAEKGHHKHKKRHHKAHHHGSGKLNLVISGNTLVVELEIPGHDIVGFEHTPKTEVQKSRLKNAMQFLEKTNSNLELPKNSNCLPDGGGEVEVKLGEEEHSEFHITYKFSCSKGEKLSFIKVLSFREFKNMKKLKAQGVTKAGQFSKTLTSKSPQFNLTTK